MALTSTSTAFEVAPTAFEVAPTASEVAPQARRNRRRQWCRKRRRQWRLSGVADSAGSSA